MKWIRVTTKGSCWFTRGSKFIPQTESDRSKFSLSSPPDISDVNHIVFRIWHEFMMEFPCFFLIDEKYRNCYNSYKQRWSISIYKFWLMKTWNNVIDVRHHKIHNTKMKMHARMHKRIFNSFDPFSSHL